nr:FG-GAP repeat protein [Kofleriaceae bacterium]
MRNLVSLSSILAIAALGACMSDPESGDAMSSEAPTTVTPFDQLPDLFGYTIAVADFDGDGLDDLAIAEENAPAGGKENAGTVQIWHGSATGLVWSQTLSAADAGVPDTADGAFGFSLAARDIDGDHKAELVVGCWACDAPNGKPAGTVFVYKGGTKLTSTKQVLSQSMFSGEVPEAEDAFGASVAIGFFGGPSKPASIVVGVPDEVVNGVATGWVNTFTVGSNLLAGAGQGFNYSGFGGNETVGSFGAYLAVMDVDGDGVDDLVVESAPGSTGGLYTYHGYPLRHLQRIVEENFVGSLAVGHFHGRTFTNGQPMQELAARVYDTDERVAYVQILSPQPDGSGLVNSDAVYQPGNSDSSFGFGEIAAADFNHDGDDEIVVSAPGSNKAYIYKSTLGESMTYWTDRALPGSPSCLGGCDYGEGLGIGHFHSKTPPNGDFDMAIGVPYAGAGLVDYYQAGGTGTPPSFVTSFGPH